MYDSKAIEQSLIKTLTHVFAKHGIFEAVVIVAIPHGKNEIRISCNYMAPPGRKLPTPLEQIKVQADIALMKAQTDQIKLTKPN